MTTQALPAMLAEPMPPRWLALVGTALAILAACYCVLHDLLVFDNVSASQVAVWAAISTLPWLLAFECSKFILRRKLRPFRRVISIILVLLVTLTLSGLVQWLVTAMAGKPWDAFLRLHVIAHLPETLLVGLLTLLGARMTSIADGAVTGDACLPLDPSQIHWIKSAGNYVEVRTDARRDMIRMTLRQAEAALDPDAFVRISRSMIVNRAMLAAQPRERSSHVRLVDGSEHKVGNAYRARIARIA